MIMNSSHFQARNELIAKVKMLGPFHIFLTLSCAETRWYDVFVSILERRGYDVKFEVDEAGQWDGDEDKITVMGQKLWDFIDSLDESKNDLWTDCIFVVTMHFEERVKCFLENILLGDGEGKVPIEHYSYRVEFQARGMPHIHLVAWIKKEFLESLGIHGKFADYPEGAEKLADLVVNCELPKNDEKFKKTVQEIQKHTHTKSCLKRNNSCRYNIPKLPSKKTILAKPFSNMTEDEKNNVLEQGENTFIC